MITMTLEEVARAVDGGSTLVDADARRSVSRVSTDTRALTRGDLFVALDGPNFRGADFVAKAFAAGAEAVVGALTPDEVAKAEGRVIAVQDGQDALTSLAAAARAKLKARVVAITGSVGKTTTKDALAAILSESFRVVAAKASFNNQIGVPLTILEADEDTEVLVLEIGASLPGEITKLSRLARPDLALVTAVAPAHLEGFGSIEAVLREKLSIGDGLEDHGRLILNANDQRLRSATTAEGIEVGFYGVKDAGAGGLIALDPRVDDEGVSFRLSADGPRIAAPLVGAHNLENLLAAATAARALGMDDEAIARGAAGIRAPRWRMQVEKRLGAEILLDCYNANPASMTAALETLSRRRTDGRRLAVLGDMAELGADSAAIHRALADDIVAAGCEHVILVGREVAETRKACAERGLTCELVADAAAAGQSLRTKLAAGDLVLVKGSRSVGLEKILTALESSEEGGLQS